MPDEHSKTIAEFDRALAEHDVRQLADELGYAFVVLTDGTIVLEPPADPSHCGICAGPHVDTIAGALAAIDKHTRAAARAVITGDGR